MISKLILNKIINLLDTINQASASRLKDKEE
jgi:hypothetical protein